MKTQILIGFILFSSAVFSQNWMPFIPGGNHFISVDFTTYETLYNINQDSTVIDGDVTQYFFNRHFPDPEMETCFDSISDIGEEYFVIDRCDVIADTFYFYSAYTPGFKVKFINPQTLGYSWEVPNTNPDSDWPYVTIVYDSIGTETVFGMVDSVKYFSVNVDVELPDVYAIDKVVIKLSKSNGFIQFLNWFKFENPLLFFNYHPDILEGYSNAGLNSGFIVPTWNDYFHYVEGDILIWRITPPAGAYPYYDVDTVLDVYEDDDLVKVITTSVTLNFHREAYKYMFGGPLCKVMYGPEYFSYDIFEYDGNYSLGTVDIVLDKTGVNPQIYQIVFSDIKQRADDCHYYGPQMGFGKQYSFHSYLGLVSFTVQDWGDSYKLYDLVGAIIDGVSWGDLTHLEVIGGNTTHNTFLIQPNPVADIISIPFNNGSFKIFNLNGQLMQQNLFSNSATSVIDLPSGLYTIVVQSNGVNYRSVFVKN